VVVVLVDPRQVWVAVDAKWFNPPDVQWAVGWCGEREGISAEGSDVPA
jgi:hypothetical protein